MDFLLQVDSLNQRSANPVPNEFLWTAAVAAERNNRVHNPGDVRHCLREARALSETQSASAKTQSQDSAPLLDSEIALTSDLVLDRMTDGVEQIREEIFGSSAPPFPEWSDAVAWLQQRPINRSSRPKKFEERVKTLYEKSARLREEWSELLGGILLDFKVDLAQISFYSHLDGSPQAAMMHQTVVRSDREQRKLWEFAESAARGTGFSQAIVLAYVLSGIRIRPKRSYSTVLRFPPGVGHSVITIPKSRPSWRDVQAALKASRRIWGNRKGMDEVSRTLMTVMKREGGIPPKGIGIFWDRIAGLVREELELETFSANAARRRYQRFPQEYQAMLDQP